MAVMPYGWECYRGQVVHTPVFVVEQYNLILAYDSDALCKGGQVVYTPVTVGLVEIIAAYHRCILNMSRNRDELRFFLRS